MDILSIDKRESIGYNAEGHGFWRR